MAGAGDPDNRRQMLFDDLSEDENIETLSLSLLTDSSSLIVFPPSLLFLLLKVDLLSNISFLI